MSTYLQFAVLGLALGAVYVGLANGLLLVYRATGIINFAQGAIGMWGAYVYAQLRIDGRYVFPVGSVRIADVNTGASTTVALVLGLATSLVVGLVVHLLAFRPVRRAPVLAQVVMSVAVMITLQALVVMRFGASNVEVGGFLSSTSYHVGGATVPLAQLQMMAIMVVLSALAWSYLRFTKAGVATRASADNERAAILMGFSPDRLAAIAMLMSSLLATVGVILGGTITGINPTNYTLYVVPALAVILVARMSSIPVATLAALLLGILQSILTLISNYHWWPRWAASGLDQIVPFFVVVVILLAFGKRLPARGSLQSVRLPDVVVPRIRPAPAAIVTVLVAVLLVVTNGTIRFGLTTSIIMMLLALSYVVITGYLGQISLAQAAFAGAAGFTLSKASVNWHIPFPISVLLCAFVAAVLGAIVALPALRIRGAQLAIVTIAAALAIERFVFNNYALTPPGGNPIKDPSLFGLNLGIRSGRDLSRLSFSFMVLVIAVLVVLAFVRIVSGDTGRAFLAVRANERAAASAGIDVRLTKFIGFTLSAFIAGLAGCLLGYSHGQLSAESFTVFIGLQVLAFSYLGGVTTWGGAAVAGALAPLGIVYSLLSKIWDLGNVYALISGLLLILTAILNPVGIAGETSKQLRRIQAHRHRAPVAAPSRRVVSEPVKGTADVS